jgi:hypothetical protein
MSDDDEVPLDDLAERLGLDDDGDDDDVPVAAPTADTDDGDEADASGDQAGNPDGDASESRAPLDGIADRVRERRERDDDDEESPFESMSVGEVDGDAVWSELVDAEEEDTGRHPGVGGAAERVGVDGDHVVEKATFCKRCPFLAEPPTLACENEGTDILEVVDSEHFRVRGCPMVDDTDATIGEL